MYENQWKHVQQQREDAQRRVDETAQRLVASAFATDAIEAEAESAQPIEGIAPWRKLVVFALAQAWPCRFVSVAVPACVAERLAVQFSNAGYQVRHSEAMTPESHTFTVWLPPSQTARQASSLAQNVRQTASGTDLSGAA
jgi:hypothetical protein